VQGRISRVFTLPTILVNKCRASISQPLVDYSRLILLTSNEYLRQVETLAAKRTKATVVRDARKVAAEECKRKREEDRVVQVQKKKDRDKAKALKARERAYWANAASHGCRNKLQARMKSTVPPPPSSYRCVYIGCVPAWCIANQHRCRLMLDQRRWGVSSGTGEHDVSSLHGHGASQTML
jgi:hypothetical protein